VRRIFGALCGRRRVEKRSLGESGIFPRARSSLPNAACRHMRIGIEAFAPQEEFIAATL
jgi:hypothetical protein